jgi:hypothetical protein
MGCVETLVEEMEKGKLERFIKSIYRHFAAPLVT